MPNNRINGGKAVILFDSEEYPSLNLTQRGYEHGVETEERKGGGGVESGRQEERS